MVFYNTCSIREKAAQKVFSRLGLFNPKNGLKDPTGKIIGVLGCVAQQEGTRSSSARRGSVWSAVRQAIGSSPRCWRELEAGERRVTGLETDTDETFETELTRRDHPFRAYVTIIEGCDKACTYCVVPHTRGPERSRASASVLAGSARTRGRRLHRGPIARPDGQLLSRSSPRRMSFVGVAAGRRGRARHSPRALHDFASARSRRRHRRRHGCRPGHLRPPAPARAVRLDAYSRRHAAHLHARGVSRKNCHAAERPRVRSASPPTSSWAFRARPRATSRRPSACWTRAIRRRLRVSVLAAAEYARGWRWPTRCRRKKRTAACRFCSSASAPSRRRATKRWSARLSKCSSRASSRRESQWLGRTSSNRLLNFTSPHLNLLGEYRAGSCNRRGCEPSRRRADRRVESPGRQPWKLK